MVLWGDNIKDKCGYRAGFAEQGASASLMAAAMFLDRNLKFPGMTREASDAVAAYTQIKMVDATRLLKIPEGECPEKTQIAVATRKRMSKSLDVWSGERWNFSIHREEN